MKGIKHNRNPCALKIHVETNRQSTVHVTRVVIRIPGTRKVIDQIDVNAAHCKVEIKAVILIYRYLALFKRTLGELCTHTNKNTEDLPYPSKKKQSNNDNFNDNEDDEDRIPVFV